MCHFCMRLVFHSVSMTSQACFFCVGTVFRGFHRVIWVDRGMVAFWRGASDMSFRPGTSVKLLSHARKNACDCANRRFGTLEAAA